MLSRLISRPNNSSSVLAAINKYKGSKTQAHLHEFDQNPSRVEGIKQTIDY